MKSTYFAVVHPNHLHAKAVAPRLYKTEAAALDAMATALLAQEFDDCAEIVKIEIDLPF